VTFVISRHTERHDPRRSRWFADLEESAEAELGPIDLVCAAGEFENYYFLATVDAVLEIGNLHSPRQPTGVLQLEAARQGAANRSVVEFKSGEWTVDQVTDEEGVQTGEDPQPWAATHQIELRLRRWSSPQKVSFKTHGVGSPRPGDATRPRMTPNPPLTL
jgi:hypothetical protein